MNENDQIESVSKTGIEFVTQTHNLSDIQLQEYHNILKKFIDLVPNLQEINREEKINKIFCSTQSPPQYGSGSSSSPTSSTNYSQQLEGLQNLDINSKSISDLQILQSVISRIHDLQHDLQSDS